MENEDNTAKVIADLKDADRKIKKSHRYSCGLESAEQAEGLKATGAYLFFSSPDGQNYELYRELAGMGYRSSGYNAPYLWNMSKHGMLVQYMEGDIYIKPLAK